MTHTPHELSEDFPGDAERIRDLRIADPHFARLVEEYHAVNRAVHRAETLVEPLDSLQEQDLRRKRVQLKDQIVSCLKVAS
ncbi:DUF465 domain-containing protein [Cereibacter sphaeroides]|uniref:YdcH family protein n=1 Tax=Cereibacter sphaeroides TaxID=1063 RepID=UPI001F28D631|nr:DUF465 domain-containing protein [Cereibacter sphaeroides]MCE6951960.1 DUF465 domain-containing protein [Cereibacter sphaeroides]MCE6961273.1 DUF465 domain-containing protein [Cereibacter sphaeroides]MCE6970259.1 DUF465 domain-containing protein [Cereibacter sphaeroides]MCE6974002.1 DUF465 domain-containing protein [Cereibacter sphaeroides]